MSAVAIEPGAGSSGSVPDRQDTVLDVVVPVYNEEVDLGPAVRRLHAHLCSLPWSFQITVADNASTDATPAVARSLEEEYAEVRVRRLEQKGRGRALKQVWGESASQVLVYMDVDLSTDLKALLPLVAPLISGHSDLAIGSRLRHDSRVSRGPKREVISRGYNLLVKGALRTRFSDAQCGFKAIRSDVARAVLPLVEDDAWFFDTELLVLAERAGLRIHEVPVDWVDDPDSRVDIVRTALEDLRGIARLGRGLLTGRIPVGEVAATLGRVSARAGQGRLRMQLLMFAVVGVGSTLAYALVYLWLRQGTSAQVANLAALVLTAVANTAANRRFTFGVRGRGGRVRHQAQGLAILAAGLGVTSATLWLVDRLGTDHHAVEVAALTAANLFVTVMRFVLMRAWVFTPSGRRLRRSRAASGSAAGAAAAPSAGPAPARPEGR